MTLLPKHFDRLRRLLQSRGRSQQDAEDLIQEAFLRMHEYCSQGHEVREPEGFLVRTALRLSLNAYRDAHRELYSDRASEELTFLVDTNPTPDEVLAGEECLVRMRDSLDTVSRRTRDAFFMHRLDGLSYAQIAQRMRISVSAVEKHIALAMTTLAEANFIE